MRADVSQSTKFKDWKRNMIHDILVKILSPMVKAMEEGVNMLCPDGKRRLCLPRIAQYIADYEEQRMLASILNSFCVKCTIPAFPRMKNPPAPDEDQSTLRGVKHKRGAKSNMSKQPATSAQQVEIRRRAEEDCRMLCQSPDNNRKELKKRGCHPTFPFTEKFHVIDRHLDIHRILAPDLLHQASKCFHDYLYKWVVEYFGKDGCSKAIGEIDARFSQLPPYPRLRAFPEGISNTTRWTGNEYKQMLRVYLGLVKGLMPDSLVSVVKAYFHIHRLGHYVSHTDDTLRMLNSAVYEFTNLRNDPNGLLLSRGILRPEWRCPRIHMFDHYTEWIQDMGALPFASTDRSEACHRPLKEMWRGSNKGPQWQEQVLRQDSWRHAWDSWEAKLLKALH